METAISRQSSAIEPRGKSGDWGIQTICRRFTLGRDDTEESPTGEPVDLSEHRLYVTARSPTGYKPPNYEHYVSPDEQALRE